MAASKPDWKPIETLPWARRHCQVHRRVEDNLRSMSPLGEGYFKVNGREIAHIDDAKDRRQAFRELKKIADGT